MLKKRNLIFICLLILGIFLITGCFLIPTLTYTVTFDSQGGSEVNSQTVEHGGLVIQPTNPTWTGRTFGGWYKEFGCNNPWDFNTDTVTSDVTLYAQWTINTYTVTYNGNGSTGGTVPTDPSSPYEYEAIVTVLGNTGNLVKTGHDFAGWNILADGSGTTYIEGQNFTMDGVNVTLYAKWTPDYDLRDTGPAGGLIFYDKGSYSNGWRYMETAPASTEWTNKEWGSYGTFIGGTGTGIGTGQNNTTTIVTWLNNHSETGKAAQLCNDLTVGVYSDWFLPSKGELNLMYTNLKVAGVGGFGSVSFWSSSESNANFAWFQGFFNGAQGSDYKLYNFRVRAVRAF